MNDFPNLYGMRMYNFSPPKIFCRACHSQISEYTFVWLTFLDRQKDRHTSFPSWFLVHSLAELNLFEISYFMQSEWGTENFLDF